jgi:FtsP/CotA-like multicopper oxidase with cupredoxin domain
MKHIPFSAFGIVVTAVGLLSCATSKGQSLDNAFANPPMLSSHDGRLDVDLVAAPGSYTIDGHQFQGMLYNGTYIPPIWRVRLGDTVTVNLHNELSEPTNRKCCNFAITPW